MYLYINRKNNLSSHCHKNLKLRESDQHKLHLNNISLNFHWQHRLAQEQLTGETPCIAQ